MFALYLFLKEDDSASQDLAQLLPGHSEGEVVLKSAQVVLHFLPLQRKISFQIHHNHFQNSV